MPRDQSVKPIPKDMALLWAMVTPDNVAVEVCVTLSALHALGGQGSGPVTLLKDNLQLLERLASKKFDRDRGSPGLPLWITKDDLQDPGLS